MSEVDEKDVDPIKEMRRIAQNSLDAGSWGFKETYHSVKSQQLILDSPLCRINLIWGGWDQAGGNNMYIRYGRLHALDVKKTMLWNGEECHCWHDIDHPLNFLDGRLPADVVKRFTSHPVTDPFYKNELRQKFHRQQPDWLAAMNLAIWKHYGNRFFEIFDLKRPDLWEKYQLFLKEFYDLKGRRVGTVPPLDKVCWDNYHSLIWE
jgi:hypothetical protein